MSTRDREIETLETRITELESELAIERREKTRAEDDAKIGRLVVIALVKRHFEDMDDYDEQLRIVREWARYPEPT